MEEDHYQSVLLNKPCQHLTDDLSHWQASIPTVSHRPRRPGISLLPACTSTVLAANRSRPDMIACLPRSPRTAKQRGSVTACGTRDALLPEVTPRRTVHFLGRRSPAGLARR
ncbi:hypothetical protein IAQ61_000389 [Plenodomus lingam]|nr:hypothetical protein IAQ61_000389 [Plenodomus lingam]